MRTWALAGCLALWTGVAMSGEYFNWQSPGCSMRSHCPYGYNLPAPPGKLGLAWWLEHPHRGLLWGGPVDAPLVDPYFSLLPWRNVGPRNQCQSCQHGAWPATTGSYAAHATLSPRSIVSRTGTKPTAQPSGSTKSSDPLRTDERSLSPAQPAAPARELTPDAKPKSDSPPELPRPRDEADRPRPRDASLHEPTGQQPEVQAMTRRIYYGDHLLR